MAFLANDKTTVGFSEGHAEVAELHAVCFVDVTDVDIVLDPDDFVVAFAIAAVFDPDIGLAPEVVEDEALFRSEEVELGKATKSMTTVRIGAQLRHYASVLDPEDFDHLVDIRGSRMVSEELTDNAKSLLHSMSLLARLELEQLSVVAI